MPLAFYPVFSSSFLFSSPHIVLVHAVPNEPYAARGGGVDKISLSLLRARSLPSFRFIGSRKSGLVSSLTCDAMQD